MWKVAGLTLSAISGHSRSPSNLNSGCVLWTTRTAGIRRAICYRHCLESAISRLWERCSHRGQFNRHHRFHQTELRLGSGSYPSQQIFLACFPNAYIRVFQFSVGQFLYTRTSLNHRIAPRRGYRRYGRRQRLRSRRRTINNRIKPFSLNRRSSSISVLPVRCNQVRNQDWSTLVRGRLVSVARNGHFRRYEVLLCTLPLPSGRLR